VSDREGKERPELVATAPLPARDPADGLDHLAENRQLIVRRALLATAVGGVIPIPVLDDYFAARVRAGLLMKLAERRRVDLVQSSAELLGDPREGTALRNATLTAATLIALKFAWRKFFTFLTIGRSADEMATSFQVGMLFDHYCAKVHVGSGIDRARAVELRAAIFAALAESERGALVSAFREGSAVLGRSVLEAPTWMSGRIERAARRWAETGGRTADPGDAVDAAGQGRGGGHAQGHAGDAGDPGGDDESPAERRWLDRATGAVESRLGRAGQAYLGGLVRAFERRWQDIEAQRNKTATAAAGTG
jgi:hypothetical protein